MSVKAVLAALALLALPGLVVAQGETGTVTGEVVLRSGQPAESAVVRIHGLDGVNAITDEFGRFSITGVPAGAWIVAVEWIGYEPDVAFVEVEPDGSYSVTLVLGARIVPFAGVGPPLPDGERLSVARGMVSEVLGDPDLMRHLASRWPDLSDGDTVRVWVPWLQAGASTDSIAGVRFQVGADCPDCVRSSQYTFHGDEAYVAATRHVRLGLEPIGVRGLRFCTAVLERGSGGRTGNCLSTGGTEAASLTYWETTPSEWTRIPCLPRRDLGCSR